VTDEQLTFDIEGMIHEAAVDCHDHGLSGWRELPIVPARLRDIEKTGLSKAAQKWIAEHYPASMQVAGAPVITERSGLGTRHPRAVQRSTPAGKLSRASVVRRTSPWIRRARPCHKASGSATDRRDAGTAAPPEHRNRAVELLEGEP
jgi:hypothetical protein